MMITFRWDAPEGNVGPASAVATGEPIVIGYDVEVVRGGEVISKDHILAIEPLEFRYNPDPMDSSIAFHVYTVVQVGLRTMRGEPVAMIYNVEENLREKHHDVPVVGNLRTD